MDQFFNPVTFGVVSASSQVSPQKIAPLNEKEVITDQISQKTFSMQQESKTVQSTPKFQALKEEVNKNPKTDQIAHDTFKQKDSTIRPIELRETVQSVPKYQRLTEEQVSKMSIQQLLEAILQACYLIQHDSKKLNSEFLQTLQNNLDLIVKRLSNQQATTTWSIPSFISVTANGLASFIPAAKGTLETLGGATKILGDILQQTDRSKETPISAELSQAQGAIQSLREKSPSLNNEEEKSLQNLEKILNELYQLIMAMCR